MVGAQGYKALGNERALVTPLHSTGIARGPAAPNDDAKSTEPARAPRVQSSGPSSSFASVVTILSDPQKAEKAVNQARNSAQKRSQVGVPKHDNREIDAASEFVARWPASLTGRNVCGPAPSTRSLAKLVFRGGRVQPSGRFAAKRLVGKTAASQREPLAHRVESFSRVPVTAGQERRVAKTYR